MKKRVVYALLGALSALCLLCAVFCDGNPLMLLAVPYAPLGNVLRAMSLSGGAGNIFAIVIYAVFCLLPVLGRLLWRKKWQIEDIILPVVSIALFFVEYWMINPALPAILAHGADIIRAMLGGCITSLLICWAALKFLRHIFRAGEKRLLKIFGAVLAGLGVLFAFEAFYLCPAQLRADILALRAGNTGNESALGPTYFFLFLRCAVNALPWILDIKILSIAADVLCAMQNPQNSSPAAAAKKFSRSCARALAAALVSNAAYNLLQMIFSSLLLDIHGHVQLPLVSVSLVLGALLVSRLIEENGRLKQENELFV